MLWLAAAREGLDDNHASAAARTWTRQHAGFVARCFGRLGLIWARWRGEQLRWDPPTWLPAVMAVAFIAFTVARNLPGWTWLSPA